MAEFHKGRTALSALIGLREHHEGGRRRYSPETAKVLEEIKATPPFLPSKHTPYSKCDSSIKSKSTTELARPSKDTYGARGPEKVQVRPVQHVALKEPARDDVMEAARHGAAAFVEAQDPTTSEPSGARFAQPFGKAQAHPRDRRGNSQHCTKRETIMDSEFGQLMNARAPEVEGESPAAPPRAQPTEGTKK